MNNEKVIKCDSCGWLKTDSTQNTGTDCWACVEGTMRMSEIPLKYFYGITLNRSRLHVRSVLKTRGLV